jgi:hypothetical protein
VAPPGQRFERKFYILPKNTGFAAAMLRQLCRPDREFPRDRVRSLYFDTADLDQYERSVSGEFRKDKVRIRWYDCPPDEKGEVPAFIELKSRQGFASSKQRRRLLVPAPRLAPPALSKGIVSRTMLLETLGSFGHFPEKPLQPVILITYRRHRYNEILTGVRVSFDDDIRAVLINAGKERFAIRGEIALPGGVIEVKGPTLDLPVTLRRMRLLDIDWSRFSKYGACLDACFDTPGSVGLFSPPGKLISI